MNKGVYLAPSFGEPEAVDTRGNVIHRYPGFCEQRIYKSDDENDYETCKTVAGFVVMTHVIEVPDPNNTPVTRHMCRVIATAGCVAGLHRAGSNSCSAIKRRTWTCPTGYLHRNEFNSCYKEPDPYTGKHPACGAGAPEFVAQGCADYVQDDFANNPGLVDCGGFKTGASKTAMSANARTGSSKSYWCAFNAAFLKLVCHGASRPATDCAPTTAHCLKRASETGGCTAIAQAIRCRALQAKYQAKYDADNQDLEALRAIRAEGCSPCILLPFQSVSPECPVDMREQPAGPGTGTTSNINPQHYFSLLRVKESYFLDTTVCEPVRDGGDLDDHPKCRARAICDGAPQGRLDWTSSHYSDLAIVNSPAVLTIIDLPRELVNIRETVFRPNSRGGSMTSGSTEVWAFDNDEHDDPLLRIWPEMNPGWRGDQVTSRAFFGGTKVRGSCVANEPPMFKVILDELRPDIRAEATEIRKLFGAQALAWWDNLTTPEQRRHTEARGLKFWGDLATQADQDLEREKRASTLTEEIACNVGVTAWCRWTPTRSGYFKAIAAGAWIIDQLEKPMWETHTPPGQLALGVSRNIYLGSLEKFLSNPSNTPQIKKILDAQKITAEEAGLVPAMTALLPHPAGAYDSHGKLTDEWLYTADAGAQYRCPSTDLRVRCGDSSRVGNYTETEPVGIWVHEVRVATRTPTT